MEMSGELHVLGAALHRGKSLGAHEIEGCVGFRAGLDVSLNFQAVRGNGMEKWLKLTNPITGLDRP
jgi:hypothetical protein